MEENRKEIVSDAYIYNTLGNTLKGKQMNGYAHTRTHTHTQGINVVLVGKL